MTSYAPVGQLSSFFSKQLSLIERVPWVYAIANLANRFIWVGETYEEGGLLAELANQLAGPQSTLQVKCLELGVVQSNASILVVAARLPSGRDPAEFDGASSTIRMQCATTLHAKIAQVFIPTHPGWTDLSSITGLPASEGSAIERACEDIFTHVRGIVYSMSSLSRSIPLHISLLDPYPAAAHESESVEEALTDIELKLHDLVMHALQTAHPGNWWQQIPLNIRTACTTRREEDGGDHTISPNAYMMFIDFVEIARSNWPLIGPLMERVAGKQGRDAGTSWIKEVNQIRKTWAHPIRGKYIPIEPGNRERVLDIRRRLTAVSENYTMKLSSSAAELGAN